MCPFIAGPTSFDSWRQKIIALVLKQQAYVDRLQPGSSEHMRATHMLSLLQDSMSVIGEAQELVEEAQQAR